MWKFLHPDITMAHLGYIPEWLNQNDPRPAREQLDSGYFVGFQPFNEFTLNPDNSLKYPGDPALPARAEYQLRNELVVFYDHDWVAVIQPNRTFVVARMD
jgi:hypothetical protein